jgi:hypothetical protein
MAAKKKVEDVVVVEKAPVVQSQESVADQVWNKIKGQVVEVFGLPGKCISDIATRHLKEVPEMLFLTVKASSLILPLEEVCSKVKMPANQKLKLEQTPRYIQISVVTEF